MVDEESGNRGHQQGDWLGAFDGVRVRDPGELDGPVVEIHGEHGMAAFEANGAAVSALTELAAEVNMSIAENQDE